MIRGEQLSKGFGEKALLKNVDFLLPEYGRIAIVGRNGCGKTTLLALMLGHEEPDKGRIVKPSRLRVGTLAQECNEHPAATVLQEAMAGAQRFVELDARIHRLAEAMGADYSAPLQEQYDRAEEEFRHCGGLQWQARARMILRGLGFTEAELHGHPQSLSGGWRMRIELARLLVDPPDVLFLDEPTNHLDLPSILWLEKFLLQFPGLVVFVSHDRDFLDRLATGIWHLHEGILDCYVGHFSRFLEQREERLLQKEQQRQALEQKKASLEKFVSRFGAKASKAGQAQSRLKMLERLRSIEADDPVEGAELVFPHAGCPPSGKVCLRLEGFAAGFSKPLVKDLDLQLVRGQRLAILGPNGIGKSTLLKTIAGELNSLGGISVFGHGVRVGYFAQDQRQRFDAKEQVFEALLRYAPHLTPYEARALLGRFLFSHDDAFKTVEVLSGGELSRLGLAVLLAQESNLLLLDEPTNHLDMSSAEALGAFLTQFEGAVVFVSHERAFVESVATHVLGLTGGGNWASFLGGMAEYEKWILTELSDALPERRDSQVNDTPPSKERYLFQKEVSRILKKRERVEERLNQLTQKLQELQERMCHDGEDHIALADAQEEMRRDLAGVEAEWFSLSEQIAVLEYDKQNQ